MSDGRPSPTAAATTSNAGFLSGLILCVLLAATAITAAPLAGVPAMVIVLALGILLRAVLPGIIVRADAGIHFSAKTMLRVGVALLGLGVVATDLASLGLGTIAVLVATVAATVSGGFITAKAFGLRADIAGVSATSVGICGASAALAASSVMPPRDGLARDTTIIIVTVSLLSTIVMVLYPWVASVLGLDGHQTALLFGAAIHDVAQVAGAGFAVSPEVGIEAVTVKMIRVACLLPVVMTLGMAFRQPSVSGRRLSVRGTVPLFLVAFLGLAIVASLGDLPDGILQFGKLSASWTLTVSVAAIGLSTALSDFRTVRPQQLFAIVAQTVLQLTIVVLSIKYLIS